MSVSADTVEALYAVEAAWDHCQEVCDHRNPSRDDEGQGRICEHPDNTSGMEQICGDKSGKHTLSAR